MIINKKIRRTMLESRSQYLGSMALIMISCLLFTMLNLLSANLEKLTTSFAQKYVQEDANFVTDKKLNNITDLEAKFNLSLEEGSSFDYEVGQGKVLRVFTENAKVNIPTIIAGRSLRGNDILVDPNYAKANKLNLGDSITIYNKTFKVSGYMSLPNYIYPLKSEGDILTDPNNFGIAVMKKNDFAALNRGNSFYAIKFNGPQNDKEKQMSQFKDYLRNEKITILNWVNASTNLRITFVDTKLKGINQVSSSMPSAILLLTCILTGIIMSRMLKREAAIIGTLYAIGYKKRQILNHYLRYALLVAVFGGISGTLLGALTLKPMLSVMVAYFNMPVGSVNYSLGYLIISLLLPIAFLSGAGYIVIGRALKKTPLELMRGGQDNYKVNFFERNLKLEKLKFSTKFKIREQLRSIPRSLFLLLGVTLATMLLLLGFAAKSSMNYVIQDGFKQAFKYNYHYVFNSLQQGTPPNGEAFSETIMTIEPDSNLNIAVYGVSPNSQYITFKDKAGNKLSTNQVIITKPLADKLKVKPQGTVKVINKLDAKEYTIKIDCIAESYVGNYIYLPLNEFNKIFDYPTGSYMGLWSTEKLAIPENKLLTTLTVDDMKKALETMTQPIQTTVGSMAFMSFIIGLIAIYVVTSMIIEENKENISLMKILGYRKKEVYAMILNSSSIFVILGYILGIPLILASLGEMFSSLTKEMSISLPITISYGYVLTGFIIIYLTYELAMAISKGKVNRISLHEVLKSRLE